MGRNLGPADLNRVALVVHQRLGGSIRLSDLYPDRSSGSWVAVERVPEERGQARRQRKAARNRKARTGDSDHSKGEVLAQRVDSRISTQLV